MAAVHAFRMRLLGVRARAALLGLGLLLLVVFLAQGIFFIRTNAPTYDEPMHLAAGYSYFATGDFRLDSEHPPFVKQLQALPLFVAYELSFSSDTKDWRERGDYLLGQDFLYAAKVPADQLLGLSRLVNLSLGGLLIVLVGWWAYRLWGYGAALLAMLLGCLEPNLIAHASLVTTDVGVTLFIFLSIYLLWEYIARSRWWLLGVTGLSVGLALASKFSALLVIPIICLIVVAVAFLGGGEPSVLFGKTDQNRPLQKYLHAAMVLSAIFFVALLVIPPVYSFQGYEPWFSGLRRFRSLADAGRPAFFLGEYSYHGWWSYYIVAFLIKTPVGILLLIAGSLIFHRRGKPLKRHQAIFLLLPVIVILLAMTQSKVNIGVRHILPIYPFLFVLAGRLATVSFEHRWVQRLLVGAPILLTAVSALRIAPHQLAYFNELVGGPEQGYRYLSDSNLDWGQDLKGVQTYMLKEKLPIIYLSYFGTAPPSYYGIRYQYVPGAWPLEWPPPTGRVPTAAPRKILAISVSNLLDVGTPADPLFRWLFKRRPIEKIGYSIFIYDLTDDREGLIKLEESYIKAGLRLPI